LTFTRSHKAGCVIAAEQRACELMAETELFDELGLGRLAGSARMVARDVLELAEQLAAARSAVDNWRQRHEDYVAYHQRHCFHPDGKTRSGIVAQACFGRMEVACAA
jgi:hypothetical protein